jgi:hypothetical protein
MYEEYTIGIPLGLMALAGLFKMTFGRNSQHGGGQSGGRRRTRRIRNVRRAKNGTRRA